MNRRELLVSTAGVLGALGVVDGQMLHAAAATYDDIIKGSRSEGPLSVYSNWGEEFWPIVLKPFNAKYPWVKVEYLDLGANEILERYLIERSARSKTADLQVPTALQVAAELSRRGEIVDYVSPESPFLPKMAFRHPGVYALLLDAEVFAWNKRLLPAAMVPTGFADLANKIAANPDLFNGRIVYYPAHEDAYRSLAIRRLEQRHGENLWKWLDVIAPKTRFETGSGAMIEKLLSGEYLLSFGLPLARCVSVVQDPARAKLFDWGFPKDGTLVGPRQAGITVGAANPNSARLLLDFLLSVDGQIAIARSNKMPIRLNLPANQLPSGAVTLQTVVDAVGAENVLDVTYSPDMEAGSAAFIERFKKTFKVRT